MMALLNLADAPPVSHQLTRQASGDEMPLSTPGGSPGACGQFKTPRGIDSQTNEAMGSPVRERPSLHLSPFGLPEPNLSPHKWKQLKGHDFHISAFFVCTVRMAARHRRYHGANVPLPSSTNEAQAQSSTPAKPTGLTAQPVSHNSVTLAWDDPEDSSITGYQVLRRPLDLDEYGDGLGSAEFVAVVDDTGTSATTYTDTSVAARTRYVYRVKARNAQGLGGASNDADAETAEDPDSQRVQPCQEGYVCSHTHGGPRYGRTDRGRVHDG